MTDTAATPQAPVPQESIANFAAIEAEYLAVILRANNGVRNPAGAFYARMQAAHEYACEVWLMQEGGVQANAMRKILSQTIAALIMKHLEISRDNGMPQDHLPHLANWLLQGVTEKLAIMLGNPDKNVVVGGLVRADMAGRG